MTQLDTRHADVTPRPTEPIFWVAAAVVILVIGAVACSSVRPVKWRLWRL